MTIQMTPSTTIERRFRAMGSDAHIIVVDGDEDDLDAGLARIGELERRWSRFLEASDVSHLNRHAGRPVIVSPDTVELVERCLIATDLTNGLFDPTVGAALIAHGYDRDFGELTESVATIATRPRPAPGLAGIDIDRTLGAITIPAGVTLDAGGIGKGVAADLTARLLLEVGVAGALVNLGGDLRAVGTPPAPDGWVISVPDPRTSGRELLRLALPHGAVATSSRVKRSWRTTEGNAHHLIDPATGRPANTDVLSVTVVAGEAWWAEALTKALFLTGPAGLTDIGSAHAVITTGDGERHATAGMEETLR